MREGFLTFRVKTCPLLQQHNSNIALSVFRTVGAKIPGTNRLRFSKCVQDVIFKYEQELTQDVSSLTNGMTRRNQQVATENVKKQ